MSLDVSCSNTYQLPRRQTQDMACGDANPPSSIPSRFRLHIKVLNSRPRANRGDVLLAPSTPLPMIFQMHVSALNDTLSGIISFVYRLSLIRPRRQALHSERLCLHLAIDLLSQAPLNGPHYFRSHSTVFKDAFNAQYSAW